MLMSFRTFRHTLIPKPVSWLGIFFVSSYSKTALAQFFELVKIVLRTIHKLRYQKAKTAPEKDLRVTY
jgi:hypothetical protein